MAAKKTISGKQGRFLFLVIFALITILGFVSIISPDKPMTTPTENSEKTLDTRGTYSGYLFRVVAVTVALVVFLIVGLRIYRKQIQLHGKNSINMNMLGRYYINDKQYLLKVAIEDRNLLLGVSESSINLITELDLDDVDPDEPKTPFGTILDLETKQERPA